MERYRIVLADDHSMFRNGVKRLLGDIDVDVVGEVGDGLELLSLLNTCVPDLIILDISMPKLRGIEAVTRIKTKCPEVKILILSMHKEYLQPALNAGANGYLLKEDAERILFTALQEIRQGRTYISPRLEGYTSPSFASDTLSQREREVLKLIAEGQSNKEIAALLCISARTVESHRSTLMAKLSAKCTADLVKYAIQNGYL